MKNWMKRIVSAAVVVSMSVALLAGCGKSQTSSTTADAAITMDEGSVSMDEAKLYAYVMKSQYEAYYGSEIWDMEIEEGTTFGDSMKEMITKELVQMVLLSSKADDYGVSLSDEDKSSVDEYISNFKTNVGEDVMAAEGITEDAIRSVVEKSTLAGYVYQKMMEEEAVELTDEETEDARCIKVQHVLISTTETTKKDSEGNNVDMTDEEKEAYLAEQKAKAEEVLEKAKNGEDFKALSDEYTAENAGFEFSFDKNGYDPVNQSSMVEPFYTAAWELEEGQISDLVESQYGYHIIKCISLNDEEATAASVEEAKESKKYTSINDKITQMVEEAKYTESDAWKEYKIVSKTDETTDETGSAADTTAESSSETDTETTASETSSSETESETQK